MSSIRECNGKRYMNRILIETGTHVGRGVQAAMFLGFSQIRSVEWNPEFYAVAAARFQDNPHVRLWLGTSEEKLPEMLADLDEPVTFFLDSHFSECDGTTPPGTKKCPVLEELAIISGHPVKTHTIIIDDIFCADSPIFGEVTFNDVVRALLAINPDYRLRLEPVGSLPYSLVAVPPESIHAAVPDSPPVDGGVRLAADGVAGVSAEDVEVLRQDRGLLPEGL